MNLEDYRLGDLRDWASLVFVRVMPDSPRGEKLGHIPIGYVFITTPVYAHTREAYKMPGGKRSWHDRTPSHTARRELAEETGLYPPWERSRYEGKWLGSNLRHWKLLFSVDVALRDAAWVSGHFVGDSGESPKYFSLERFRELVQHKGLKREHYGRLCEYGLVPPEFFHDHP